MNFLGVGPLEAAFVIIIAVIVLGPERFPQAAVQVARAVKWLRGYANDATSDLRTEFVELTREYELMRAELDEVRGTLNKSTTPLTDEMTRLIGETKPKLQTPTLGKLLTDTKPIVEPGGELPPDYNGTSGNGSQH
jgi:Sec-independent protein translocase protein TatA